MRLVAFLAACGPAATTPTVHNDRTSAAMTIAEHGVGAIDAKTHVTLTSLRGLLPGYDIAPQASMGSTRYDVTKNGDKVMYVVANDDGSVSEVDVTSTAIADPEHHWRVGDKLPAGVIDTCLCAGDPGMSEVAICFKRGEHVAVVFARQCVGMFAGTDQGHKILIGEKITRLAWQAEPWEVGPGLQLE